MICMKILFSFHFLFYLSEDSFFLSWNYQKFPKIIIKASTHHYKRTLGKHIIVVDL